MPPEKIQLPRIMVAPTGARRTKRDHQGLPISIPEIRDETVACAAAGADALHLHIRDPDGRHALDPGLYQEAIREVRAALPGFPIQITTESAGVFGVAEQLSCLQKVRPEAVSISIREIARDPSFAAPVYDTCAEHGTSVQHIIYDQDDWAQLVDWRARGIVKQDQADVIFVLGRYTPPRAATIEDANALTHLFHQCPGRFMVCAFGPAEHDVLCAASALGADLRIGFENNIHGQDGKLAASNAANVAALRAALLSRAKD